jgi:tryptophanyl-tRNA synthetase
MEKKRILTGDRPTGKLHLGHFIGSIKNRVALQDTYECYLIIADLHTLTTKPQKEHILSIRDNVREMVLDYLACGIDPLKTTIFLQSQITAVYELNLFFEMLVSLPRLTGLPSLKEMARNANIPEDVLPFGLIGYPVLQSADILMAKAHLVPVGKDNEAHIELTRDIARRFNQYYGEVFPMPEVLLTETPTLIGTDNKGKMSKSAGNCIFLSDDESTVTKKVNGMYTDPNRVRADTPGTVEGNPIFTFHDLFNDNKEEVASLKERYQAGSVGDVEVKKKLSVALNHFLNPFRERRKKYENDKGYVEEIVLHGTKKMQEFSDKTLDEVKSAMGFKGLWSKIGRLAKERHSE